MSTLSPPFTVIQSSQADIAFSVLANVADDAQDAGTVLACLAVVLGHQSLLEHAKSHAVMARLCFRARTLCALELETIERIESNFRSRYSLRVTRAHMLDDLEGFAPMLAGHDFDPQALSNQYLPDYPSATDKN